MTSSNVGVVCKRDGEIGGKGEDGSCSKTEACSKVVVMQDGVARELVAVVMLVTGDLTCVAELESSPAMKFTWRIKL